MSVLVSTTWLNRNQTDISAALMGMQELDIDGIELGSTHRWQYGLMDIVRNSGWQTIFVHNFFPPASNNLVVNLASDDQDIRIQSIDHARRCLWFSAEVGASLYTVHPGFLAEPRTGTSAEIKAYDFQYAGTFSVYEQAYARMVEALSVLRDEAKNLGVRLAIETQGSLTKPGVSLLEKPDEYERFFNDIPSGIDINLNLAHSIFASRHHQWDMKAFVARHKFRLAAVEISHNDGSADQHAALVPDSFALDWMRQLADVPMILEFRDVDRAALESSIKLARTAISSRYSGSFEVSI
jgi:sugar phosphate isomerase/epimerase